MTRSAAQASTHKAQQQPQSCCPTAAAASRSDSGRVVRLADPLAWSIWLCARPSHPMSQALIGVDYGALNMFSDRMLTRVVLGVLLVSMPTDPDRPSEEPFVCSNRIRSTPRHTPSEVGNSIRHRAATTERVRGAHQLRLLAAFVVMAALPIQADPVITLRLSRRTAISIGSQAGRVYPPFAEFFDQYAADPTRIEFEWCPEDFSSAMKKAIIDALNGSNRRALKLTHAQLQTLIEDAAEHDCKLLQEVFAQAQVCVRSSDSCCV